MPRSIWSGLVKFGLVSIPVQLVAALLRAMTDAGRVAIGKFVMRDKEHLVAIRPSGDALVLQTLFYADDVVRQEDMKGFPGGSPDDRQLRRFSG